VAYCCLQELADNPGVMVMLHEQFVDGILQQIPLRFGSQIVNLVRHMLDRDTSTRFAVEEVMQELQLLCRAAGLEASNSGASKVLTRSRQSSNASTVGSGPSHVVLPNKNDFAENKESAPRKARKRRNPNGPNALGLLKSQ